ncbi:DUF6338 family protein [Caballeronia sp. INML1]|uniref:DUF6338 family protein n=1 Tax=Caballeronia sp. INML1 TaxID=2921760 RepID=UPI0020296DAC|nr:DUF6338 family protein [Caballeronia sp. INML1]
MNIAFPAVLLFALLFPGIVFYHFYQDREVREADFTPFSRALFIAILAACILNATTTAIVHFGWGYNILVGDILRLLIGGTSPSAQVSLNAATLRLNEHPFEPIGFLFISIFLAIASSLGWRWGVRGLGLDRSSSPFQSLIRASAPWYYLFRGIDALEQPDAVLVAAIVSLKDASYLYTGILEDYFLTSKGELDRLVLSGAARRKLEKDHEEGKQWDDRFYAIDGDYLVIRQSEWTTLNFKYLIVQGTVPDVAEVEALSTNDGCDPTSLV